MKRKLFVPTFSIPQLQSNKASDFGCGNFTTLKRTIDILARAGIKGISLLPITETDPNEASLFSRVSSNALSPRLLDLAEIPELKKDVTAPIRSEPKGRATKINYQQIETKHREYLEIAFKKFFRQKELEKFSKEHSWWLDDYARFKDSARPDFHKFVQMEIYRQATKAFKYAREKGIEEIELLTGVGVMRESAEGRFMKGLFDATRQIGCFSEPESGYPLQLWGFLAEKMGPELLMFKARSFLNMQKLGVIRIGIDHACGFFGGYTTFPIAGSEKEIEAGGRWEIPPGQEQARRAYAKEILFGLLREIPRLALTAETVGDFNRRVAAEEVITEAIESGFDITLMRALPWEEVPLTSYGPHDRLSLTHDMPALTGLLTGMVGDEPRNWINGDFVRKFLNRLGISTEGLTLPIPVSQLTVEFMSEVLKKIITGSNAGTIVLPLAALFNLIPKFLNTGLWQYINILPGTPSYVGNPKGNWEMRLPPIEELEAVLPQYRSIFQK